MMRVAGRSPHRILISSSTGIAVAVAVAAIAVSLAVPPVAADLPLLDVQPKSVRQGECAFVTLRLQYVAPTAGECRWQNKRYTLFPVTGGYRAIIPIVPDAPTGMRSVTMVLTDSEGETRETALPFTIVKTDFGTQKLSMSKQTTKLYSDPSVAKEGDLIHAALMKTDAAQLWSGPFAWPVKGRVSTGFGLARTINGKIQYRHKGLDIAAAAGTPVLAPSDAVVRLARDDFKLHGKTIVLDHGQSVGSIYIHLSQVLVKPGEQVTRGKRIGLVGATGAVTGPHLHWGVYVAGQAVDPRFWVDLPAAGQ
jgi:hypothetical protein